MAEKYHFRVHVSGERFSPESLALEEIADFLVNLEQMVAAVVAHKHPNLDIERRGVIRLSSLTEGSVDLACSTPYRETGTALRSIGSVAEDGDTARLPEEARAPFLKLLKFNHDFRTNTEIRESGGTRTRLAILTPDTRINSPAASVSISGTTTLYGELLRIGGDPPRARIRLMDGEAISCTVRSRDLARELARRLYETIGVRGKGEWETVRMKLVKFHVDELTEYRQTSLMEAIESLREVAEEHYQKIDDINAFVADLRGREPDNE